MTTDQMQQMKAAKLIQRKWLNLRMLALRRDAWARTKAFCVDASSPMYALLHIYDLIEVSLVYTGKDSRSGHYIIEHPRLQTKAACMVVLDEAESKAHVDATNSLYVCMRRAFPGCTFVDQIPKKSRYNLHFRMSIDLHPPVKAGSTGYIEAVMFTTYEASGDLRRPRCYDYAAVLIHMAENEHPPHF